jgi:hypothetical protein
MGNYSMELATQQIGVYQGAIRIWQPSIITFGLVASWGSFWLKSGICLDWIVNHKLNEKDISTSRNCWFHRYFFL